MRLVPEIWAPVWWSFPSLRCAGIHLRIFLEKAVFIARAEQAVGELAGWTGVRGRPAILCGTVMAAVAKVGKQVRNVAVLLAEGKVNFVQQKMLLPFYDVFDEQRYFEAGTEQTLTCVDGQPLAITICEDAWNDKGFWPRQMYPVDPVEGLMSQWEKRRTDMAGKQRIILNISASPYWQGKPHVRQSMLAAIAMRHGAYVAMVNQVGGNDSLVFDGSSVVIRPEAEWRCGRPRLPRIWWSLTRRMARSQPRTRWRMGWRSCGARWFWVLGTMCGSAGSARCLWD